MTRALVVGALLLPTVASAHIHMLQPLSRTDDALGDPQKQEHCGTVTWDRAANANRVQTFRPGQTITVMFRETINHSGWYRIAFQPSGDVFSIPPAGNGPAAGNVASNFPSVSQEGMTDPATGTIILRDRIPDPTFVAGATHPVEITLPNMECSNCTLQFMQVMNDAPGYDISDLYFNCADIVLSANAPDAGPMVTTDAAVPGGPDAGPTGGAGEVQGGCAAGAGAGGLGVGLALLGLRRRRGRGPKQAANQS